jgi:hypothetical protein
VTVAVCVKCGSIKHGAFNHCRVCRVRPETETDLAYSLALTDHYFSVDVLNQISADMKRGKPRPSFPKEQEDHFREAARMHVEKFGEMLDLPPPTDPIIRRRSAKFHGWVKSAVRPGVVSGLRWRAGFGWIAVALLLVPSATAVLTRGTVRTVAVTAALLVLLFIIYQWRRWNRRGWPQVHHRAMLAYAQIAGFEAGRAQQENREFNKTEACRSLALGMIQGNWRQASVDAMIGGLLMEGGTYFADLLERHGARAVPNLNAEAIHFVADKIRGIEFGPQLVIGNIVENTFGGEEAARYVIALATGKAH